MSKKNEYLLKAVKRGYTVDRLGNVFNPSGNLVNTYSCNGYLYFGHVKVHRFVAYFKFGNSIFSNEVRHLDDDSLNNTWDNIGIGTRLDNILDFSSDKRHRIASAGAAKVRRLSLSDAELLRKDKRSGATHRELCQKYGISKTTVSEIVNNKTYIPQ